MNTQKKLGLILEGNSTKSAVLRFPALTALIGPIKAPLYNVAARVSNFIQAGTPVSRYEEFASCDLIFIRVPDSSVARVVKEMAASKLDLSGKSVVLCESWLPSDVLNPLKQQGATVGTLLAIPAEPVRWFALEGQFIAVKRTKRLLSELDAQTVELKPGTKHLYFAATTFAAVLPRTLFTAAQRSLRRAGISGNQMQTILDEMGQEMLRDVNRGSRAGWSGALLECPEPIATDYLEKLQESMPDLAMLLKTQLSMAEPWLTPRVYRYGKRLSEEARNQASGTALA